MVAFLKCWIGISLIRASFHAASARRLRKAASVARLQRQPAASGAAAMPLIPDQSEENIPIMDGLGNLWRYPDGRLEPINGHEDYTAMYAAFDQFFDAVPELLNAKKIKQPAGYIHWFHEDKAYLDAHGFFNEGSWRKEQGVRMSERADNAFAEDMNNWVLLHIIQSDVLKMLRMREVNVDYFSRGCSTSWLRSLFKVEGFTHDYLRRQVSLDYWQAGVWGVVETVAIFNLLGTLSATNDAMARTCAGGCAWLNNLIAGASGGPSPHDIGNFVTLLERSLNTLASISQSVGENVQCLQDILDKAHELEAKALIQVGAANIPKYWNDVEMGHLYAAYTGVESMLRSLQGEFNARPVVVHKISMNMINGSGRAKDGEDFELKKGTLLAPEARVGPLKYSSKQEVLAVWRFRGREKDISAWVDPVNIGSAARYTSQSTLPIYQSNSDNKQVCYSLSQYVHAGEPFSVVAKECDRCKNIPVQPECWWKLGDGRGWIPVVRGSISQPLASDKEVEDELGEAVGRGQISGEFVSQIGLGNVTLAGRRNRNRSGAAVAFKTVAYVLLSAAALGFALATWHVIAVSAGVFALLKGCTFAGAVFCIGEKGGSAILNSRGLETVKQRSFMALTAVAHWERHLFSIQDCDITDHDFCRNVPGCSPPSRCLCLRGGAFFRREQLAPQGKCVPGDGSKNGGSCILHKDCQSGYCHSDEDAVSAARSLALGSNEKWGEKLNLLSRGLIGQCRRACKLGQLGCQPISPMHMFGLAVHNASAQRHASTPPAFSSPPTFPTQPFIDNIRPGWHPPFVVVSHPSMQHSVSSHPGMQPGVASRPPMQPGVASHPPSVVIHNVQTAFGQPRADAIPVQFSFTRRSIVSPPLGMPAGLVSERPPLQRSPTIQGLVSEPQPLQLPATVVGKGLQPAMPQGFIAEPPRLTLVPSSSTPVLPTGARSPRGKRPGSPRGKRPGSPRHGRR